MTQPSQTPPKSALREYLVLAILILVGTPIAVWWGYKDGKDLAVRAYGDDIAAYDEDEDEDYEDEDDAEAEGADAGDIPEATPEAIARGAAVYQLHCVACHGADADGKGPAAVAFTPGPRDFTDPSAKWTIGREPEQIHQAVSKGVPGTGMAGFAAAMSASELWDLVHYIGSLPGVADAR